VKRKKTEIVIELDEVFIIRRPQQLSSAWCVECDKQVRMLTPEQAATLVGLSSRFIYRWIEAGSIHFSETGDRQMFICQNSLPKLIE
jgi:excisionase family DNA binding protein